MILKTQQKMIHPGRLLGCLLLGMLATMAVTYVLKQGYVNDSETDSELMRRLVASLERIAPRNADSSTTEFKGAIVESDGSGRWCPSEARPGFTTQLDMGQIHKAAGLLRKLPADRTYGSHLLPLAMACLVTKGPIFEMGAGRFSTRMLHRIAMEGSRRVLTAETDADWLEQFTNLTGPLHTFRHVDIARAGRQWDEVGNEHPWSVVFVDHRSLVDIRSDVSNDDDDDDDDGDDDEDDSVETGARTINNVCM